MSNPYTEVHRDGSGTDSTLFICTILSKIQIFTTFDMVRMYFILLKLLKIIFSDPHSEWELGTLIWEGIAIYENENR